MTQAQIDAARLAIVSYLHDCGHTFADDKGAAWGPSTIYPHLIAKAAITAAAEVGPQERLGPEFEKVLHDNLWELYARDTMKPAEAQIDAGRHAYEKAWDEHKTFDECLVAAFTAAAEVGPKDAEAVEARWRAKFADAVKRIEARERERCAQMVDEFANACDKVMQQRLRALATVMREGKDKP